MDACIASYYKRLLRTKLHEDYPSLILPRASARPGGSRDHLGRQVCIWLRYGAVDIPLMPQPNGSSTEADDIRKERKFDLRYGLLLKWFHRQIQKWHRPDP